MGALYIATVVSAVLYGLCLLQAFLYFQSKLPFFWCLEMIYNKFPGHKRDQWYIKAAVSPPKNKASLRLGVLICIPTGYNCCCVRWNSVVHDCGGW